MVSRLDDSTVRLWNVADSCSASRE